MSDSSAQALGLLAGIGIIVVLVAFVIGIVVYIAYSYPLYCMAKNANLENPWLAFVPIAQYYTLCMLSDDEFELFGSWKFPNRQWGFWGILICIGATLLLSAVPVLGGLVSFAGKVAVGILMWRMYYDMIRTFGPQGKDTPNAMIMAIGCAVINIVAIIILWMYKDNMPQSSNPYVDSTSSDYLNQ